MESISDLSFLNSQASNVAPPGDSSALSHPLVQAQSMMPYSIPPRLPRPRLPRKFTTKDWELHREEITALYKKMTLTELRALMRNEYGMEASEQQYKRRLEKWSINNKHIKKGDWNVIVGTTNKRAKAGKPSRVRIRKHLVTQAKVSRYLNDHPEMMNVDVMISEIPPHITIYSPHKAESDTPEVLATPNTYWPNSGRHATPSPDVNIVAAFHNPETPSTAVVLARTTSEPTAPNIQSQENDIIMTGYTCEGRSPPASFKEWSTSSVINTCAPRDTSSPYAAESLSSFLRSLSGARKYEGNSPNIFGSEQRENYLQIATAPARRRYRQDDEDDFEGELSTAKMLRGEQHQETISAALRLADVLEDQGRFGSAEAIIREVLSTYSDEDDQNTDKLHALGRLARILDIQGFHQNAMKIYRRVIHSQELLLGAEHKHTLSSKHNLAWTLYKLGKYPQAEQLGKEVIEIQTRIYGADHPDTPASIGILASAYMEQGHWDEAEKLEVRLLESYRKARGEEHPATLTSMHNLASTFGRQGRWKEAEVLEGQTLEIRMRVLGEEHPSTLTSMSDLALLYSGQGRWDDAEKLDVEVLRLSRKVRGDEHPHTLVSKGNLAATYSSLGRFSEAAELEEEVLKAERRLLGHEHPQTIASMHNLAFTWKKLERGVEAVELMGNCVDLRTDLLGTKHPDTINSMHSLACWWKEQGRDEEAVEMMTRCVELYTKVRGADYRYTKSCLSWLESWRREDLESERDDEGHDRGEEDAEMASFEI